MDLVARRQSRFSSDSTEKDISGLTNEGESPIELESFFDPIADNGIWGTVRGKSVLTVS